MRVTPTERGLILSVAFDRLARARRSGGVRSGQDARWPGLFYWFPGAVGLFLAYIVGGFGKPKEAEGGRVDIATGRDVDVERMLASYYRICTEAGVEPLPDDEAREQATALMAVLVPAFEVTRRGVQVALTSAQEYS